MYKDVNSFLQEFFDVIPGVARTFNAYTSCSVNMNEKEITVEMPLPGFKREQVDVEFQDKILRIQATPTEQQIARGVSAVDISYPVLSVHDIDTANASAKMEDGILTITLPKSAKSGSKIKVV